MKSDSGAPELVECAGALLMPINRSGTSDPEPDCFDIQNLNDSEKRKKTSEKDRPKEGFCGEEVKKWAFTLIAKNDILFKRK